MGAVPRSLLAGRRGPLLGNLFESLVALSIRTYAQAAGVVALEAKLASAVSDADLHHLRWLRERLGIELLDAVVVNTGPEPYRTSDGIAVIPLGLLGA